MLIQTIRKHYMNISNSTIYVIGIDQGFLLIDVYDSIEEAIEDIESPDKHHIAFQYTKTDHVARVYKTSPRELSRFYKEFTIHNIPDPNKYFKAHLTQVYPDPFDDYTINELAVEGLKWYNDGHYDNSPLMHPIYKILKRIYELSDK